MPAQIDRDQLDARRVQRERQRIVTPGVFSESVHERDPGLRLIARCGLPAMQEQIDTVPRRDGARRIEVA